MKHELPYRYRFTEPSGKQHTIVVYARSLAEAAVKAKYEAGRAGIPTLECKMEEI